VADRLTYESKFQWMARLGFFVRGLLYIVIALLVIGTGRTEDLTGALEYLDRGFGQGLMIFLVAGMTGYGLWRVSDAVFGMESGRGAWARRTAAGASGAIYLFLAYKALRIMVAGRSDAGDAHEHAAVAMGLPAGVVLLGAAAAVLAGAGLVQLWKAVTCSFLRHLDDRARQPFAKWLGRTGYAARGAVFLTIGYLLARAALEHSAARAGGVEQALDALRGPLQFPVAIGLLLFGTYSMVEARYRSIHRPPAERIEQEVREKVTG
jgi:Domain of Unknown Function (DUF1206)